MHLPFSRYIALIPVICLCMLTGPHGVAAQEPVEKRFVFLYDGDSVFYQKSIGTIKEKILKFSGSRYEVSFHDDLHADWNGDAVKENITETFQREDVDFIVALGIMHLYALLEKDTFPIPTFFAQPVDQDLFNLPNQDGTAGVHNFTYLASTQTFKREFESFQKLVAFKTLYVPPPKAYMDYAGQMKPRLEDGSYTLELVSFKKTPVEALNKIEEAGAEAVYIVPAASAAPIEEESVFIETLNELKIPSFAMAGYADIEAVALPGLMPRFFMKWGRRVAV